MTQQNKTDKELIEKWNKKIPSHMMKEPHRSKLIAAYVLKEKDGLLTDKEDRIFDKWIVKLYKDKLKEPLFTQTLQWYISLELDGFDDIETKPHDQTVPQVIWTTNTYSKGMEYYSFVEDLVKEQQFQRPVDKFILEQHSQGLSVRRIEKKLKEEIQFNPTLIHLSYQQVQRIIRKYVIIFAGKMLSGETESV